MELRQDDPFLGARQPETLGNSQQDTVVLFLSPCNTPLKKLQNLYGSTAKLNVICVLPETNTANRLMIQRSVPHVEFVIDKEGALRKQLNASFTPRCFALSKGKLAWKQNFFEADILKLANTAMMRLGDAQK